MPTEADRKFLARFDACEILPEEFDHRAHVRLAYVYLCEHDTETAYRRVRRALERFLKHHGIEPTRYHDTLTCAWILAVHHFMQQTPQTDSADSFIDQNPEILDSEIMLTHYSAERLFSDEARAEFMEPDRDPIPRYERSGPRAGH